VAPESVGGIGHELSLHVVEPGRLAALRVSPPAAVHAAEAVTSHQPGHPPATDLVRATERQLGVEGTDSVGRPGCGVDLGD
jgi:hypothetical protein